MKFFAFNHNHSAVWRPFYGGYAYGTVEFPLDVNYAFDSLEDAEKCVVECAKPGEKLDIVSAESILSHTNIKRKAA